jgi:c-di-GMP-binding flagellar brake protein YcgR
MFEDTRPAELDAAGDADAWADFRIRSEAERLRVLRELRDGNVPVMLGSPGGDMLMTTLWALDTPQRRMTFSADAGSALLARLVAFDEAVAVAYCDSVKLQFDLHDLVLVRGATASVLQSALPTEIYRFQRRSAYRVRPPQRRAPVARLRHPSIPEMALTLRILDVSVGGCALCLPADVPPLQAGTELGELRLELDAETQFACAATLRHVSSLGGADRSPSGQPGGRRVGCEWRQLAGPAERVLQRWIDQAQKRRRLLALG